MRGMRGNENLCRLFMIHAFGDWESTFPPWMFVSSLANCAFLCFLMSANTGLSRRRVAHTPDSNPSHAGSAFEGGSRIACDPRDLDTDQEESGRLPRLTIMEEVLLLGLKDKHVRVPPCSSTPPCSSPAGLSLVLERQHLVCPARVHPRRARPPPSHSARQGHQPQEERPRRPSGRGHRRQADRRDHPR